MKKMMCFYFLLLVIVSNGAFGSCCYKKLAGVYRAQEEDYERQLTQINCTIGCMQNELNCLVSPNKRKKEFEQALREWKKVKHIGFASLPSDDEWDCYKKAERRLVLLKKIDCNSHKKNTLTKKIRSLCKKRDCIKMKKESFENGEFGPIQFLEFDAKGLTFGLCCLGCHVGDELKKRQEKFKVYKAKLNLKKFRLKIIPPTSDNDLWDATDLGQLMTTY